MVIWTISILMLVFGLLCMADSFKSIQNKKHRLKFPMLLSANNKEITQQRLFHNELIYGLFLVVLALIILELGYFSIIPKLTLMIVAYLVIDLEGYLAVS